MSLKINESTSKVAYHVKDGEHLFPYAVDANSAVASHPEEWSFTPWGKDGKKTASVVEIPPDWQDLKPMQRISLAVSLGAERKGLTAAKADEVIQAEVDEREAASAE